MAFLPRVTARRRHARKVERVKGALFPRYVFIRLDLQRDRWRSVNGTIGMAYLLAAMETPCPVPVGFVEALQEMAGADDVVVREPGIAPGEAVRIVARPLAGGVGELLRLDARGRVEMLLDLLSGKVRLRWRETCWSARPEQDLRKALAGFRINILLKKIPGKNSLARPRMIGRRGRALERFCDR